MDRVEVARLAGEVDGQDRLRPLGDERRQERRVEVQVVLADVAEDRRGAAVLDHVRRRRPGDRRGDHLVAGADAEREQREVHRRRARGDGEDVLGLEVRGEALLEQGGAGAGRQPARAERLRDGGDLLLPHRRRLEAERGSTTRPHRPGSVRPAPHGEPGRARRPGRPPSRAPRRPGRRRAGTARRRAPGGGRPAPTRPRRPPPPPRRPSTAASVPSGGTRKATAAPSRDGPGRVQQARARVPLAERGSDRERVQVDTGRGPAELGVVPAAEPRGDLHHHRPVRPEAELRVRRPVADPERLDGGPRRVDDVLATRGRTARRARARRRRRAGRRSAGRSP